MRTDCLRIVTKSLLVMTIAAVLLGGCSNSKLRRTPTVARDTPWFCELNESRDAWDCVQDAELARHPAPTRLPGDPEDPEPAPPAGGAGLDDPAAYQPGPGETPATGAVPVSESGPETPGSASAVPVADDLTDKPALATTAPGEGPGARLLDLSGDLFAVQLIAFNEATPARQFIAERGLDEALELRLARDDEIYHVVLLGVYDTYADASAAVDSHADSLAGIEPWIRPLASVQEGMRAARVRLAGGE
jgi:septal ring-binding cell division protein DamX